ncbi:MAG: phosphoribosylglycinamide formyltransferase [candidate division Zixibacteria bacterium]|jgi:phosphoribosylglycinamide formyltransferase-1|nr:phosphoribosylglycinamide formyltransferase [candidate division Zixibacteria bacterium]
MDTGKARVAVFISGSGTDLQSLIDAERGGRLAGHIAWVVASTRKAYGLVRAADAGIETWVFRTSNYESEHSAGEDLLMRLRERDISYIALAGYLKLMPPVVVREYRGRMVNIHPALLPRYGGRGMYGRHVHEAVLASGDRESGPTVHLVDEIYDNGTILEQLKVPVLEGDTPETLAARVLDAEHLLYPKVLDKLIKGEYTQTHG